MSGYAPYAYAPSAGTICDSRDDALPYTASMQMQMPLSFLLASAE